MARVRIVKVPKAPKALSGLEVKMQSGLYGTNGNNQFNKSAHLEAGKISQKPTEVRQTLEPVDREDANLEAEKGETAVINVSGMPAHFKIGGKRHSEGGTPLSLPDNSFIFSDTAKMKIKDPTILAQFGMKPKKGGYTPAEIANKYDINKFRKVLADPNTEDLDRKTAEMMIANYNLKLAKLALAQESLKGFPQGIPVIAMPYIESMEIDPSTFMPDQAQEQLEGAEQPDAEMGTSRYGSQVVSTWDTKKFGGLPTAQKGFTVPRDNKVHDIAELKKQQAKIQPSWADTSRKPFEAYLTEAENLAKERAVYDNQLVKKGWGSKFFENPALTDAMQEKLFAQTDKATYDVYKKAMLLPEKTPEQKAVKAKELEGAQKLLDDGLQNQTGWFDWTSAGKTKDLRDILYEEKTRLTNPKEYEKLKSTLASETKEKNKSEIDTDREIGLQVEGMRQYYQKKRDEAMAAGKAAEVKKAENELANLENWSPSTAISIGKGLWKGIKSAAQIIPVPGASMDDIWSNAYNAASAIASGDFKNPELLKEPNLLYDKANRPAITTKYNQVIAALKKEKADATPSVDTYFPSDEEVAEMSPEVLHKWDVIWDKTHPKYREGGSLLEFQSGGKFTKRAEELKKGTTSSTASSTTSGTKGAKPQQRTIIGRTASGEAIYSYDSDRVKPPYGIEQAFDKAGIDRLNMLLTEYGRPTLEYGNPKDPAYQAKVKAAAGEMQQAGISKNPDLVYDYMRTKNPKPNAKLEELLGKKGYSRNNRGLQKAISEGALTPDEVRSAYKDDQWWFRGVTTQKKQLPREEYEKKMKQEGLIKQGDKSFFAEDPTQPWVYTEYEPIDPEKKANITTPEKDRTVADRGPIKRNPPIDLATRPYAPWWTQDIIKTAGAAADLARVNKYLPWQATPQVRLPDATFYDPTRELAASAEQANIQTQGMEAFTGPQALSARSAAIQGQGMKNAADIMAKYNNMNVSLANQLSQERTSILNTASQNKANMDTQLWDKYTIANQQFDNARNQAREKLRQSYIDAWTNRGKTQALNTLYPNFYTDPSTGFVNKTGYASINPGLARKDKYARIQEIMDTFPGTSFKDASAYLKGNTGEEEVDPQAKLRADGYPG